MQAKGIFFFGHYKISKKHNLDLGNSLYSSIHHMRALLSMSYSY
jgi:hypothetical protein